MNRKRNPGNSRRQKSEVAKNNSVALIDSEIGDGTVEWAGTSAKPADDYEYEEHSRKSKCDKCKHNCDEICSKYNECCNFNCASDKELLIRIICLLIDKEYGLKAIEQKMRKSELNDDLKNIKSISDLLERAVVGLGETAVSAVKKAVDAAGTMTDITSGLAKIAAGAAGTAGSTALTASGLAGVAQGAAGTAGAAAFTTFGLANTVAGTAGTAGAVANTAAASASTAGAAADIAAETVGVAAAGAVTTGAAVDVAAEASGLAAAGAATTGAAADVVSGEAATAAAISSTQASIANVVAGEAATAAAVSSTKASIADVVAQEAGTVAAAAATQGAIADTVAAEAGTVAAVAATQGAIADTVAAEAGTVAAVAVTQGAIADTVAAEAATVAAISGTQASIANVVAGEAATAAAVSGTQASIANVVAGEAATAAAVSDTKASIAQTAEDASVSRTDDIHTEVVNTGPFTLDTDEDFVQVWVVNSNNVPTEVINVIMYDLTVTPQTDHYVQSSAARENSSVLFTIASVPAVCEIQIRGLTRNILAYAVALKKTDCSSKSQAPVEARILCMYPWFMI